VPAVFFKFKYIIRFYAFQIGTPFIWFFSIIISKRFYAFKSRVYLEKGRFSGRKKTILKNYCNLFGKLRLFRQLGAQIFGS